MDIDQPRLARIVVGLDGSPDAAAAGRFAATLAAAVDAEVIGIHAMGLLEAWGEGDEDASPSDSRERVRTLAEHEWRQPFVDAGVRHRVEVRDGNPVHVLLTAAEELAADLIVVGCKGAGGPAEQLMGSTSTHLTERATIPVVVVPLPHPGRSSSPAP